ncbi:MAG: efflux RND transporter permease subunit [Candidatus Omnitrophota bacterium]|jgi:HAE1 family hydrophobic/amphiphilic exporter-1
MSLPAFSVNRPTFVSMLFTGVIIIGAIALKMLPVEMMPNISYGDITINIDVRGGIPASEIENRIAKPVEEAVSSSTHLRNILSISKEGNATIILEFEPGTEMNFAALEVREKFNRIRNKLPKEIEKPVIAKYEYMDVPIMILAVTSDRRSPEDLRKIVDERIKDRIQRVEGVARAEIVGGRESKIIIEIDQYRLQAYQLSINKVVDTINLNNSNLLAGEIKRAKDKYLVRTIGELESLEDLSNLAVATTKEGSVVRLKDIATIKDSYLEPTAFARLNAQPVISIYVQKESLANTVQISKDVNREVEALKRNLEKDIQVSIISNQADIIQQAVNQVNSSLLIGALLASLILFIFLWDIRLVFIISSSIPLSVIVTFCLMYFSKLTLNVMTLSGLALGVGMLVDNAIVVLDNTFKKRDEFIFSPGRFPEGMPMKEIQKCLAIEASEEMFLAIVASTFTTIVVFLPLFFINPEIKLLYSGIALTITYSLLASLFTAVTLIPLLASRLKLKDPRLPQELPEAILEEEKKAEPPEKTVQGAENTDGVSRVGLFGKIYKIIVSLTLFFRYLIVFLVIMASLRIIQEASKLEQEFIGIAEQNKFTVFVEMPTGTKIEITDKIVASIESYVAKMPEVKNATSKIEPWSGKIFVELKPLAERKKSTAEFMNVLRPYTEKFYQTHRAFVYYEEPQEVGTKEILLELYGYDYEVLKSLAIQVAQRLQTIPKFTDTKIRMREGRPEIQLILDKREAAMFGFTTEDVSLALHTHMRGLVATRFRGTREPLIKTSSQNFNPDWHFNSNNNLNNAIQDTAAKSEETETIVRIGEEFRHTRDDLRRISLVTPYGDMIFLHQLATFKDEYGPSEVWRKNKSRMVQVSANTGGIALGTAAIKVKEALKDLKLPKDYFWQFGGNYDKMIQNQKELYWALVISLVLVYMILAGLFESLTEPLIILSTVPMAAIGAVTALRLADKPVGTGVLIGAIMLGGIVVNNAIILIDRINFLRRTFKDKYSQKGGAKKAVIDASFDRLRPIMMTSLTTILGLIPMALDKSESANLWSPLAITVIGGLAVSTFLTLLVIPCVYLIFRDLWLVKR